jgi:hypothetical protein
MVSCEEDAEDAEKALDAILMEQGYALYECKVSPRRLFANKTLCFGLGEDAASLEYRIIIYDRKGDFYTVVRKTGSVQEAEVLYSLLAHFAMRLKDLPRRIH